MPVILINWNKMSQESRGNLIGHELSQQSGFSFYLGCQPKLCDLAIANLKTYKQFLRPGHWNLCLTDKCSWYLWCSRRLGYSMGKRKTAVVTLVHDSLLPIDAAAYSDSYTLVHGKCHSKGITGKNECQHLSKAIQHAIWFVILSLTYS